MGREEGNRYNGAMKSLRELLIAGHGPSSSHTIGPSRAALAFKGLLSNEGADHIEVTLYRSLAWTGKGHGTDKAVLEALSPYKATVAFDFVSERPHPNSLSFAAFDAKGHPLLSKDYESIGGGAFKEAKKPYAPKDIYPFETPSALFAYMEKEGITDLYEVIEHFEGKEIFDYGKSLLSTSFKTLEHSLGYEGVLPGSLHLECVAKKVHEAALKRSHEGKSPLILYLTAYAYAMSEANARGEVIVTAPTAGASGVVPACLYYMHKNKRYPLDKVVKAYLVGALLCDFIKEMAGVSGALLGCQSEIGSAASFAAASLCYLKGLPLREIEYGSEVALEHFLGLTCDPVGGYVQIPCIERNAMAAVHAYTAYLYAREIAPLRESKVSLEKAILAMKMTGEALPNDYKETSLGGLAKVIKC